MSIRAGGGGSKRRKAPLIPKRPESPRRPIEGPFPKNPGFRLGQYTVLEERDDYLLCTGFDPNATNPLGEVTPSAFRTGELLKIAKPPALQRTPWDGETITIDGVDYTYDYSDAEYGVRTATVDGQDEEQRIDPPYVVDGIENQIIVACQIKKSAVVEGMEVEDEDGTRLRWIDLNVSGRHWQGPGVAAAFIQFTIISADTTSAEVTIDNVGFGQPMPDPATATVYDALGCLLDEDGADLVGRKGYAIKMQTNYEIISLCCPPA